MYLKYDPTKRQFVTMNELPYLLNECFETLSLPNRVNSPKDAEEGMRFIDINHDGRVQKMEVFILLRSMMLNLL
jgi:Ca2+-binding EF-hand superfamily protein